MLFCGNEQRLSSYRSDLLQGCLWNSTGNRKCSGPEIVLETTYALCCSQQPQGCPLLVYLLIFCHLLYPTLSADWLLLLAHNFSFLITSACTWFPLFHALFNSFLKLQPLLLTDSFSWHFHSSYSQESKFNLSRLQWWARPQVASQPAYRCVTSGSDVHPCSNHLGPGRIGVHCLTHTLLHLSLQQGMQLGRHSG